MRILIVILSCCLIIPARAEIFTFDFAVPTATNQSGIDLDGLSSGTSVVTGTSFDVILTADAVNVGHVFNQTASPNFGINAPEADVSDGLDVGAGTPEVMSFSFNTNSPHPVSFTFVSIDFDRITGSGGPGEDSGSLNFTGGNIYNFDGSIVGTGDLLSVGEPFVADQSIQLSWVAGNGFGLESLTLEVIPEPNKIYFLATILFTSMIICYQRRTSIEKNLPEYR